MKKFFTVVNVRNNGRTFETQEDAIKWARKQMTHETSHWAVCEAVCELTFTTPPVVVTPILTLEEKPQTVTFETTEGPQVEPIRHTPKTQPLSDYYEAQEVKDLGFKAMSF